MKKAVAMVPVESVSRWAVVLMILAALSPAIVAQRIEASCQTPRDSPFDLARQCDDYSTIPITEREILVHSQKPLTTHQEPAAEGFSGGVVSVAQLLNPLSKSGRKLLISAESHLKAGARNEAMKELASALQDPSAAPYAHGILGSEYLKAGEFDKAIDELSVASRQIPGYQVFHANLADAFLLSHQFLDAEREARDALRLDWTSPQAHGILGMALLAQKVHIDEALEHLRMAEATLSSARDALSAYVTAQYSR
jgi:tetratricopeptide (TPR) repeat protein